jgi:hypothetical protein
MPGHNTWIFQEHNNQDTIHNRKTTNQYWGHNKIYQLNSTKSSVHQENEYEVNSTRNHEYVLKLKCETEVINLYNFTT